MRGEIDWIRVKLPKGTSDVDEVASPYAVEAVAREDGVRVTIKRRASPSG